MARPKYSIRVEDVVHATEYLRTRLLTLDVRLDDDVSARTAQREFDEAVSVKAKEVRAFGLNAWCEKFLDEKEWGKLKTSIRKRRERATRVVELRSISISEKAFKLIKNLASRDGVTYSEALEKYLGRVWRSK